MIDNNHSFIHAKMQVEMALGKLGVMEYFSDPEVTEILINTDKKMWIKKLGIGWIYTEIISENAYTMQVLKVLASLNSIELNEENPKISTELPGSKSRVEGLIPPVVPNPKLNIRKKISITKNLRNYLEDGFLNEEQYNFLKKAVEEHKNILVIGGTDTGKTTFVNGLLSVMDDLKERLIILEEVEELQTKAENVDRIKVIPGIYSARDALKSCMRLSPERIIFGELRGEEAYDFLNGLNSGHPGGITTIHANDGMGGLKKLENYISMGTNGNPMSELIGMTVDIVIVLKMHQAKRYLDEISLIKGYEKGGYILENYFKKDII